MVHAAEGSAVASVYMLGEEGAADLLKVLCRRAASAPSSRLVSVPRLKCRKGAASAAAHGNIDETCSCGLSAQSWALFCGSRTPGTR